MAILIDGRARAKTVEAALRDRLAALSAQGVVPGLHVLLVGEDPASQIYVRSKARRAERAGLRSEITRLPQGASPRAVLRRIAELNADESVDGILVQLPVPGLPTRQLLDAISPDKDVDGFHALNAGLLLQKRPRLVPCTPLGILSLLDAHEISIEGKRALVVGRSEIVGRPMAALLMHRNATVTVAHSRTRNLKAELGRAEIVVAALGRMHAISAGDLSPGAAVIDVGIHRKADETLTGDVNPEGLAERAGAYTPVPGGVGPMTICMLLVNTVRAALLRRGMSTELVEDLSPRVG